MEKELRRRQSILSITGLGVMAFGLWDFLKLHLYFLLGRSFLLKSVEIESTISEKTVLIITYIVLLIVALTELLIRIYIGRGAVTESKDVLEPGQKKSHYLGLAIFVIIVNAFFLAFSIIDIDALRSNFLDHIASLIVDTTSLIMLFELVSSARKVRELRQKLGISDRSI